MSEYKTIKAYPTIEVSKEGNFRHRAVKAYKGKEIIMTEARDILMKKMYDNLIVVFPKISKDMRLIFSEEDAVKHFVDTWIGFGIAKRRVSFINGDVQDLRLENVRIK